MTTSFAKRPKTGSNKGSAVDPRSIELVVDARRRLQRSLDAHRAIPLAGFISNDYHSLITTRGDFLALWETEGIDSSCLSEVQVAEHHRQITLAINESDRRLMVHLYFVKDKVDHGQAAQVGYADEVVNAIDGAQQETFSRQTHFATRFVYCLEWKTPFVASTTWLQKIRPMLGDIFQVHRAEARRRLLNRIQYLIGLDEPAVEASEKALLDELQEFTDAAEAFFVRMRRIRLGDQIDASAAEGVGASALEFTKIKGVDAFDFFDRLWNWDHQPSVFLPAVNHLAHYIASRNEVDCGRYPDMVVSGERLIALYTVRAFRDPVEFDVLRHFRSVPAEMIVHLRYYPMSIDASSKLLSEKVTTAQRMGGWTKGDPLRDQRMEELVKAMKASVRGEPFGHISVTIAITGDDKEDLRAKRRVLEREAVAAGVVLRREAMNIDFTWLAMWPNNHVFEFSRLNGQSSLAAGAMMPYRMPEGYGAKPPTGQVFPEPLCTLLSYTRELGSGSPTRVWIGVSDLNHFCITGRSGGGKSFLVNYLLSNWGRYAGTKEQPHRLKRWVVDRGGSYAPLCELLGGSYQNVGDPHSKGKMNPLDLAPAEIRSEIDRLVNFVFTCMASTSQARVEFGEVEAAALSRGLLEMATDMERLGRRGSLPFLAQCLRGNPVLYERIRPWIPTVDGGVGGEFAHIFPDAPDEFGSSDFVVFNFSDEFVGPSTIGPIMSYILMKLNRFVMNPVNSDCHKLLFIDEMAIFTKPESGDWKSEYVTGSLRNAITKAIKEWRKAGGAIGLATQDVADFLVENSFFDVVRRGIPTRIYLQQDSSKALTDLDRGFGLDPHLASALKDLPKGVFLMEQRGMRRYLQLKPSATTYAVWTTDPVEKEFRRQYIDAHPFTPDNPALKVFGEIGGHIQDAKASGNPVRYLANLKV